MGVFRKLALFTGAAGATAAYQRFHHPPRNRPARLRVRPVNVGHRGAAGLAPENTLEGCRVAVEEWGSTALEVDVRATRDDIAVLLHDPTVDRTTDGEGAIRMLTLDEAQALDAGAGFDARVPDAQDAVRPAPSFRGRGVRIPTFAELLETFPDTTILVDLKCRDAAGPLADAIRAADAADRVIVAGERIADRGPLLGYAGPTGIAQEDTVRFFAAHHVGLRRFWQPTADVACLPETHRGLRVLTPGVIRGLHERGLAVWVWTVNDANDMRRLLHWGADGIITDRPDTLQGVLKEQVGTGFVPIRD